MTYCSVLTSMSTAMTSKRKRSSGDGEQGSGGDHSYLNKKGQTTVLLSGYTALRTFVAAKRNVIQLVRKTLGSRLESKLISDIVTGNHPHSPTPHALTMH